MAIDEKQSRERPAALNASMTLARNRYVLFYSPGACSLAVHIVLEELGVEFELIKVDAGKGETLQPDYLAINPKGRVPALAGPFLKGNPAVLTEAPAILLYLGRPALTPDDPLLLARCLEWLNWLSSNVHAMSFSQLWRPQRFVLDQVDFPAVKGKGEENLDEQFALIEGQLADGRDWIVADAGYSVVDAFLLVFYLWGLRIGRDMSSVYPCWSQWAARMLARPAVQRAMRSEGIA